MWLLFSLLSLSPAAPCCSPLLLTLLPLSLSFSSLFLSFSLFLFLFSPPFEKPQNPTERDPLHQGLIVERAKLRAREQEVDLTSKLGRAQAVSAAAPKSAQGGWHCSVCDCVLKDSKAWLDHINGKYHNAALGMSMRVERSSKDEVREKLDALAREREAAREKKRERKALLKAGVAVAGEGGEGDDADGNGGGAGSSLSKSAAAAAGSFDPEDAFARRVAEREAAEAAEMEAKRAALAAARKKNSKKEEEEEDEDEDAAAMAAAMGFKSFG